MLINFRFKNFKSFYKENNLSMQSTKDKEMYEINTFEVNKDFFTKEESNQLLKAALVFGGNASGKTNVIKGFSYMRNVVQLSGAPQLDVIIKNDYFIFDDKAHEDDSLYEVEIVQNNQYYKYGFKIIGGKIVEEWLDRKTERLTNVFFRKDGKIEITGLNKQASSMIKIDEATLFLSVGTNFNLEIEKHINAVAEWFKSLIIVFENQKNSLDIYNLEGGKYKEQALEILKKADIGIDNFEVAKDKAYDVRNFNDLLNFNTQAQINPSLVGELKQEKETVYNIDLKTQFNVYNQNKDVIGKLDVMLYKNHDFNSEGTTRLLHYLGFILAALDKGRVILIDEIDSKLHFLVADYLIKMFNSIDKNINNAQLICTAHNVMLMDDDIRRDQIYFTNKNQFGESTLVSLSDFTGVRKTDLFSKKYLAGFYTKLPNMNRKV